MAKHKKTNDLKYWDNFELFNENQQDPKNPKDPKDIAEKITKEMFADANQKFIDVMKGKGKSLFISEEENEDEKKNKKGT